MTMEALHRAGGVPHGWSFNPSPGNAKSGARLFIELGCRKCHVVVDGLADAADDERNPGPELTGMGEHHPPGYFAESIVNPSAVLIKGEGYIGPDGRSTMPTYPDMTLGELADLVAYLHGLKGPACHP
jgi:cytochrome c1